MITMSELLKSAKFDEQSKDIQDNLTELLKRINEIRTLWGHSMTITSGLRTKADQIRIYTAKGIPESKIPWGSKHLTGAAVDIYDPDKKLQEWCLANIAELERIQLWCEHFSATPNWVHFQIFSPKSGNRFFHP